MLYQSRVQFGADVVDHCGARGAVIAKYTDFDQLVTFQIDIDFMQYGWCQASIADHHDGMQRVCPSLEFAALCGIKSNHGRSLTGRAVCAAREAVF
jgi:hypothetical protein